MDAANNFSVSDENGDQDQEQGQDDQERNPVLATGDDSFSLCGKLVAFGGAEPGEAVLHFIGGQSKPGQGVPDHTHLEHGFEGGEILARLNLGGGWAGGQGRRRAGDGGKDEEPPMTIAIRILRMAVSPSRSGSHPLLTRAEAGWQVTPRPPPGPSRVLARSELPSRLECL